MLGNKLASTQHCGFSHSLCLVEKTIQTVLAVDQDPKYFVLFSSRWRICLCHCGFFQTTNHCLQILFVLPPFKLFWRIQVLMGSLGSINFLFEFFIWFPQNGSLSGFLKVELDFKNRQDKNQLGFKNQITNDQLGQISFKNRQDKNNLTLRMKMAVTKNILKVKFDCTYFDSPGQIVSPHLSLRFKQKALENICLSKSIYAFKM